MLILINPSASHGQAHRRWIAVRTELIRRGVPFTAMLTRRPLQPDDLDRFQAQGHDLLVAAGGDGTINQLLNTLMDPATDRPRHPFLIGAIGLGSSNDFHKPLKTDRLVAGMPARIDVDQARDADLGKAVMDGPEGTQIRYFAINASFGVTALGNHLFNHPGRLLAWAKPRSYSLAMAITVAQALLRFRPVSLGIAIEAPQQVEEQWDVSNLGILKNVHFTGSLRYDTPVKPDDGFFDVNLYEGRRLPGMLASLAHVARGRFLGTPGSHHWRAERLDVTAAQPVPLEIDGEVFPVTHARFEVIPRCVRLCE